MDNAFDDFFKNYEEVTEVKDGYYFIKVPMGEFLEFMSRHGWNIVDRGNINYPGEKYVIISNNHPSGQSIGVLEVNDGIHVGESGSFD